MFVMFVNVWLYIGWNKVNSLPLPVPQQPVAPLGKGSATKSDELSENSKRPSTPPLILGKLYCKFFMTDTEAAAGAPAVMTQRTTVTLRLWRVKSQVKMMSTSWTPFGDESQGLKASARLDLLEIELDRARPNQPKTRAASKEKPEGHVRLEVEDSQGVSKYQWAIQEHSKYQWPY